MKKSIIVTPSDLLTAINRVSKDGNIQKLTEASPVISLVFTVFGAKLVEELFKEDKNNE